MMTPLAVLSAWCCFVVIEASAERNVVVNSSQGVDGCEMRLESRCPNNEVLFIVDGNLCSCGCRCNCQRTSCSG
ncbi:hypothetical protein V1506DRAFT_529960 [Lipomyces tetrasporus]